MKFKIPKLHLVRIWYPNSKKIHWKLFFKAAVTAGSDSKADLRLPELSGFQVRFNLDVSEFHDLEKDRIEPFESGTLFPVGPYVLQWSEIDLLKRKVTLGLGFLIFTVLGLWILLGAEPEIIVCSERAELIRLGRWHRLEGDLEKIKKATLEAITQKHWVRARVELRALERELMMRLGSEGTCWPAEVVGKLELRLTRGLINSYLAEENLMAAALELKRFDSKQIPQGEGLKKKILRVTRERYLEGYRLEDEEPERADELMGQAEEVCRVLELKEGCFRSGGINSP